MKIQESGENYLETILILKGRNGYVRSIDIANELGFSKPSVSRAVGVLKEAGYITIEKTGSIKLTPLGMERATEIYEKHVFLTNFFEDIFGVSHDVSEEDACRIEHIISEETFSKMKEFYDKNAAEKAVHTSENYRSYAKK